MESFATPYPLFFTDGDAEIDKGQIGIHSVLQFKRFHAQLSRLIGIPANQLSAVFVCRRTTSEKRQKLPINENTNFNIILNQHNPSKEKDCYFLVSLKKSKKERKGSRRRASEAENADDDDSTSSRGDVSPATQRPSKVEAADDGGFAYEASSPNSVLDQPLENRVKAAAAAGEDEELRAAEAEVVLPPEVSSPPPPPPPPPSEADEVMTKESLEAVESSNGNTGTSAALSSATKTTASSNTRPQNSSSPPVTRVNGGGAAKFGVIGSSKPMSDHHLHPQHSQHHQQIYFPETINHPQARFKDPVVAAQGMSGRPGMGGGGSGSGMQRLNGAPVFPDGLNMRLLTGTFQQQQQVMQNNVNHSGGQSFATHFQEVQQQQQLLMQPRYSLQARLARSAAGLDGYGRGSDQFCQDCVSYQERNIRPPPFHCCINDRITTGFHGPSPAGPIERPNKRQLKSAAS